MHEFGLHSCYKKRVVPREKSHACVQVEGDSSGTIHHIKACHRKVAVTLLFVVLVLAYARVIAFRRSQHTYY